MIKPTFSTGSIVALKKQPNVLGTIISYVWYPTKYVPTIYTVFANGQMMDLFEWDLLEADLYEEGHA